MPPEFLEYLIFNTFTMNTNYIEKTTISNASYKLLKLLLHENAMLLTILSEAETYHQALDEIKNWVTGFLASRSKSYNSLNETYYESDSYDDMEWDEVAAFRILDYIENSGKTLEDLNYGGITFTNDPFRPLWLAFRKGRGGGTEAYFADLLHLFRQFSGKNARVLPDFETLEKWMHRHPTGLDESIIALREENKNRIMKTLIRKIDKGELMSTRYFFEPGLSAKGKLNKMKDWWNTAHFHLRFAIRNPELLNEMLDFSLDSKTLQLLDKAVKKGIPVFVNPYYLSLINVNTPGFAQGADQSIKDYVFVSEELIEKFGDIAAWEKEDVVEPGKPNAAGWILPSKHNIHRRYPEVAILIPDTAGRACGGLCVSCQRMYDFQKGHLNFNLEKLLPAESWPKKLRKLLGYFEHDSQLRDILITGGDGLMSSDKSLNLILDEIYEMAKRKKEANLLRLENEKYAEMIKIRIGTRLPVYLPQRITEDLVKILANFRRKAELIGFRQFVIQTHFESAMEITPEVKKAVGMLLNAGWMVVNQQVFIASASRRGHTAKLRKTLNDIGVLGYYTFTVKGYLENKHNFTPNARAVQEQAEEKVFGTVSRDDLKMVRKFPSQTNNLVAGIKELRRKAGLPFLATDRNVMNLPGVGKSLTFRTIGITPDGRRILEFEHDHNRVHSPVIHEMGKVVIIESKPVYEYVRQLEKMGENPQEYLSVFGYSYGKTKKRFPIFRYPGYEYEVTDELTHFELTENVDNLEKL